MHILLLRTMFLSSLTAKTFTGLDMYIWLTWRVCYKKQEVFTHCVVCLSTIYWFLLPLLVSLLFFHIFQGPSLSYCSWIYNYLCTQYLSPQTLWVRIPLKRGVLDAKLCDKVCQTLAGRWFSPGTPVSSTNKTDRHDIPEMLLKVALNTITLTLTIIHIHVTLIISNISNNLYDF